MLARPRPGRSANAHGPDRGRDRAGGHGQGSRPLAMPASPRRVAGGPCPPCWPAAASSPARSTATLLRLHVRRSPRPESAGPALGPHLVAGLLAKHSEFGFDKLVLAGSIEGPDRDRPAAPRTGQVTLARHDATVTATASTARTSPGTGSRPRSASSRARSISSGPPRSRTRARSSRGATPRTLPARPRCAPSGWPCSAPRPRARGMVRPPRGVGARAAAARVLTGGPGG